jgi:predicted O-methyltransferase YrrM
MLSSSLLQQLHQAWLDGEEHDRQITDRAERWSMITPDTGKFLYQLARAGAARRIVEIGTACGYSTIWLALAAKISQGHVTSLDISDNKLALATEHLQAFGVEHLVSLQRADAARWLSALEASPVDFMFLDADRSRYTDLWRQIRRVLRPGGVVVVDNALSHPDECAPFIEQVLSTDGYVAESYPIGKGLFVILKDE